MTTALLSLLALFATLIVWAAAFRRFPGLQAWANKLIDKADAALLALWAKLRKK